jgi:hypothetical protein
MQTPAYRRSQFTRTNYFAIIVMFMLAAFAVAGPFFSSRAKSKTPAAKGGRGHVAGKSRTNPGSRSLLTFGLPVQETIATFASDCTTPKSTFTLGETVCAITDNVDLNFPGGRWVHWLASRLEAFAYGSNTTTLITANPQQFTFVPDTTGTWKATIAETGDISQTPAVFTVNANPAIATYDGTTCTILQDNFTVGNTVLRESEQ